MGTLVLQISKKKYNWPEEYIFGDEVSFKALVEELFDMDISQSELVPAVSGKFSLSL